MRLEKLKEIARDILYLLEKEKINSIKDIKERLGKSFDVKWTNHRIKIELGASELGLGTQYIIKYITPNREIPIEIRINPNYNSSELRVDDVIYSPLGDPISRIKHELENLGEKGY